MKDKIVPFIGKEWWNIIGLAFELHWDKVSENIKKEQRAILPKLKNVLKCFKECPVDKFNSIILVDYPYSSLVNNQPIADGIALSSKYTKRPPKQLKMIWEIWNEDYNEWSNTTDLTYIANQGVLLLNRILTTIPGGTNEHEEIWHNFINDVLLLIQNKTGISARILSKEVFKEINEELKNRNLDEIKWLN